MLKQYMKEAKIWEIFVIYGLFPIVCLLILSFTFCSWFGGSDVFPDSGVMQVKVQNDGVRDDQMIIQGSINQHLAAKLVEELGKPHAKINEIIVSSPGGIEALGKAISNELDKLGPRKTTVPDNFKCDSACIELAIGPENRFEPADGSALLFHREWIMLGPESCVFCKVANYLANHKKDLFYGLEWHRAMFAWANELSPGLGDSIAQCTPNPFDTRSGIIITGRQFKEYRSGRTSAITCPQASPLKTGTPAEHPQAGAG